MLLLWLRWLLLLCFCIARVLSVDFSLFSFAVVFPGCWCCWCHCHSGGDYGCCCCCCSLFWSKREVMCCASQWINFAWTRLLMLLVLRFHLWFIFMWLRQCEDFLAFFRFGMLCRPHWGHWRTQTHTNTQRPTSWNVVRPNAVSAQRWHVVRIYIFRVGYDFAFFDQK